MQLSGLIRQCCKALQLDSPVKLALINIFCKLSCQSAVSCTTLLLPTFSCYGREHSFTVCNSAIELYAVLMLLALGSRAKYLELSSYFMVKVSAVTITPGLH